MIGLDVADRLTGADKLKVLGAMILVLVILAGAFGAGWLVNGWRLKAAYAEQVADLTGQVVMWRGKVMEQNAANDLLHEQKKSAEERRKLAADMSKSVLEGIDAKAARAASSTATDCDGVLREAHGEAR